MLAAILLCGSVVTFVACRGNSLEDIIGNSDNTVPENVIKELLGAIEPNAEIVIKFKIGDNEYNVKLKKDPEEAGYTVETPDGDLPNDVSGSHRIRPEMNYDEANNHLVFTINAGNENIPYMGIIFDVNNNTYSQVNFQASYEFKSITVNDEVKAPSDKIKDVCPQKALVKGTGTEGTLFYVFYSPNETWADVVKRYTEAFGANITLKEGTGDNIVSLKWYGGGLTQNYNLKYNLDGDVVPAKYNYIVGKKADGTTAFDGENDSYKLYEPNA